MDIEPERWNGHLSKVQTQDAGRAFDLICSNFTLMTKDAFPVDRSYIVRLIIDEVNKLGGQKAFADTHGMSPQYVNDVVNWRRDPSEKILTAIGYKKLILYERI